MQANSKKKQTHRRSKWEKAFDILMEYWDSIPDGQKECIDKRLRKLGV